MLAVAPEAFGRPFDRGERLEFTLSWLGIPAGTAVLEVPDIIDVDEKSAFHIVSRSWSNKFVSAFYKVNDRIDCYVDSTDLTSIRLKVQQREGRHKNDKEIIFDHETNKVEYTKNGEKSIHDVPPFVHDSMSSFYFLRSKDLIIGNDVKMDIFTNGKLYNITIKVIEKEKITVDAGTFDAIKIKPLIEHNDVFKNKGDIYIWLTDDEFKIPILIKTKVKIGHIKAELIKLEKGGDHGN